MTMKKADLDKSMCDDCPWNFYSAGSQMAQNYGCLPSPQEMVRINDEEGYALSCHENKSCICKGLAAQLKKNGKRIGMLKPHSDWYEGK